MKYTKSPSLSLSTIIRLSSSPQSQPSYKSIRGPVPFPVLVSVALQFPATVHLKKVSVSIISCISLGPYLILCLSPSPDFIISSSHYPRLISNFSVNSYLSVKFESHSFSKPSPSSLNPSNIPSRPVTTPSQFGQTLDISTRLDQKIGHYLNTFRPVTLTF